MLTVIENEQGGFLTQFVRQHLGTRTIAYFSEFEYCRDGLRNQGRVVQCIECDEPDSIWILSHELLPYLHSKACLTNATHTQEGNDTMVCHKTAHIGLLFFAANKACQQRWQVGRLIDVYGIVGLFRIPLQTPRKFKPSWVTIFRNLEFFQQDERQFPGWLKGIVFNSAQGNLSTATL